ncbi:hypothetical protein A2U01_0055512, partial [Trifolium medium]|nr:hypothetical protein [Trifolium medium]
MIGWKPLRDSMIRLNTDDACKVDITTGCGRVIRGREGQWIGGFAKSL